MALTPNIMSANHHTNNAPFLLSPSLQIWLSILKKITFPPFTASSQVTTSMNGVRGLMTHHCFLFFLVLFVLARAEFCIGFVVPRATSCRCTPNAMATSRWRLGRDETDKITASTERRVHNHNHVPNTTANNHNRRKALWQVATTMAALLFSTTTKSLPARAALEKVTTLTTQQAEERLRAGRKSIQYLLDHYDQIIAEGGGDNVRRYLGTVGMTSGLVQIDKVMKVLADQADDFVDYTETQNEVVQSIQQADGSAYMAIFVTTSPLETKPEKYFDDAKIEIKNCIRAMDHLATLIDLTY